MKGLNLKKFEKNDISFYLAIEAYLHPKIEDDLFFLWDLNKAIICGKNQLIPSEVNLDYTAKNDIKVFRRHTGGGAVYADEGCFMFTFLTKKVNKDEVFKTYLAYIQEALKNQGLDVVFSGRNDLLFKEKKFSGTAFLNNEFGSILHGTMMYDTSIEHMVSSLTPDDEKLISKGITSVKQRVINLKDFLEGNIYNLMDNVYDSIVDEDITLSDDDLKEVLEIEKKYLSKEWIDNNNPPYTFKNKHRFPWGGIEVFIDVRRGKIENIHLSGDFFTDKALEEFYEFFLKREFTEAAFNKILKNVNAGDYIIGASNNDITELVWR